VTSRARRLTGVSAALMLALALPAAAAPPARPSTGQVLQLLDRVHSFARVAIAPDGRQVAWVQRVRDQRGHESLSAIYVETLPDGTPRRVTAGTGGQAYHEGSVVWAPDGRQLAFLSDAAGGHQLQVYVALASGGPARRLTHVTGQLARPRWAPDGRAIALLFTKGSAQATGALVAYKPDSGVVGERIDEQRLAVVDLRTGQLRQVSPKNLYVYEYDWSPDGRRFAAEAAVGSGTDNYWIAQLYTIDVASGETRSIWKPPLQIGNPRWSPDGRTIAVIHGLMSDQGATGGDIYAVPAGGGPARNLTPGMKATANWFVWRSSGDILMAEDVDGDRGLATLDPASGKMTSLWTGPALLSSFSVARTGTMSAAVHQSIEQPPEVEAGPIGAWQPVTHVNDRIHPLWGKGRSIRWMNDGFHVQGWLIAPREVQPGRRYPMVVSVHGGPSSANRPGWPVRWNAVLPSEGYFVFLPNPRGSYGQGEAFTRANVKDFGYGDLRDILTGVDAVVKAAPVDPARVGIMGWSYGGYMTMWAVTQTHRFKAAVAGAGVANWQSYYGENRIDQWMIPFFGASVYDDPAIYARSSPITFIRNVRTPTLVLHGDRDSEVPTPQGYEFWHALKTLGVPTELVIYRGEGHAIVKRKDQRDIEERLVAWFDHYLQ